VRSTHNEKSYKTAIRTLVDGGRCLMLSDMSLMLRKATNWLNDSDGVSCLPMHYLTRAQCRL